jgi:excisionase family DNA binding protein
MHTPIAPAELITAEQLAERLKVSPYTVRLWSKEGKIPTIWLSRTVRRFDYATVLAAVQERTEVDRA